MANINLVAQDKRCAPIDLSHHYSRVTKNRKQSSIKEFYKYFMIPGIGQLAGGLPNASYFPYDTLEASVALPQRFIPTPNDPVDPPASKLAAVSLSDQQPPSARVIVPKASGTTDTLRKIDLTSALQYGTAQGYPPLYTFLRQFTRENLHPNCPYAGGPEIILTVGATDGFSKAIQALSNEWSEEKDWIREKEGLLVEEYAYMNAIQAARPRGMNIVPVGIDDEGMRANGKGGLEDVLKNWDYNRGKRPHLIYTVTIGQNPTSGVLSVQRRKDIYKLCQKYDIIIIEDDPYWYLQYPSGKKANGVQQPASTPTSDGGKSSGYAFLDSLVPSYLSVDTEGRVVRLDTFSKTIAPGCRLGWITTQPALAERLLRITETSTQQPSGFVQSMVAETIMGPQTPHDGGRGGSRNGSGWQVSGWVRWLEGLRGAYERRMQTMCSILHDGRYMISRRQSLSACDEDSDWSVVDKVKMYDFVWPLGGMFVWLELNLSTHPLYNRIDHAELAHALWIHFTTKPFLVLVSPGTIFAPTPEIAAESAWRYFRLCFAAVAEEEVELTSKRMVAGFNSFWAIKNLKDIQELLNAESFEGAEPLMYQSLMC
ncbi:MAG: hypothetical protein M1827_000387 [Pycnora praestabilis]|nr:MAG: hypothetical protein M1827_000387 [Pycnora praestabilis]